MLQSVPDGKGFLIFGCRPAFAAAGRNYRNAEEKTAAAHFTKKEGLMTTFSRFALIFGLLCLATLPLGTGQSSFAADAAPPDAGDTINTTVIHVDQYGVYAPNIVFYWGPDLDKKKKAELTSKAEKMRNKEVTITYSAKGSLTKDKRPVLVDIAPMREGAVLAHVEPGRSRDERDRGQEESKPHPEPDRYRGGPARPPEQPDLEQREQPAQREETGIPENTASGDQPPWPPQVHERDRDTAPAVSVSGSISRDEVLEFVKGILIMTERKDLGSIIESYADQVDYYTRGMVSRDYIQKDLGYYFRNWERIMCSLDGDVELRDTDRQDTKILNFMSNFYVENSRKYVIGSTSNVWKVQRTPNGLRIVDQKQKIISSESG